VRIRGALAVGAVLVLAACSSGGSNGGAVTAAPGTAAPQTVATAPPPPDPNAPVVLTVLDPSGKARWQARAQGEITSVDYAATYAGQVAGAADTDCSGESVPASWDLATGEGLAAPSDSPVIVPGGTTGVVLAGYPEDVYAVLDAQTGKERWRTTRHPVAPPSGGVLLVIGDDPTKTSALDLADGKVRWTSDVSPSFVTVDGERAYVSGTDGLSAVSLDDGKILWTAALAPGDERTTVEAGGGMVFGQPSSGSAVQALDGATGKVAWTVAGMTLPPQGEGLPLFGDGNLYVQGPTAVSALDAKTGAVRWTTDQSGLHGKTFRVRGAVPGAFVVGVTTGTPAVLGLDAATGTERWSVADPNTDRIKVFTGDGVVLLATTCLQGDG
jgi:outer membrane protein assembly factor BamB